MKLSFRGFLELLIFSYCIFLPTAEGYPTTIRFGYASCVACHESSLGGGMLTDYGKGLAASESFFSREIESFEEPPPFRLKHGFHGRLLNLWLKDRTELFPMQIDYLGLIQVPKLKIFTQIGLNQTRRKHAFENTSFYEIFLIRKIFFDWSLTETQSLQGGRDFLPHGLLIQDHTSFIRSQNRRGVTDYPTQIRYQVLSDDWLILPFVFSPSFEESASNQEWGGGIRIETTPGETQSIGTSFLVAESLAIRRYSVSLFSRLGFSPEWGVLGEYHFNRRFLLQFGNLAFSQHTGYLKPFYAPLAYLEIGFVFDYLNRAPPFPQRTWRMGPNFQVRVLQQASLILDLKRNFHQEKENESFGGLQIFVHL